MCSYTLTTVPNLQELNRITIYDVYGTNTNLLLYVSLILGSLELCWEIFYTQCVSKTFSTKLHSNLPTLLLYHRVQPPVPQPQSRWNYDVQYAMLSCRIIIVRFAYNKPSYLHNPQLLHAVESAPSVDPFHPRCMEGVLYWHQVSHVYSAHLRL